MWKICQESHGTFLYCTSCSYGWASCFTHANTSTPMQFARDQSLPCKGSLWAQQKHSRLATQWLSAATQWLPAGGKSYSVVAGDHLLKCTTLPPLDVCLLFRRQFCLLFRRQCVPPLHGNACLLSRRQHK